MIFTGPPSALCFMLRAFAPSPGLDEQVTPLAAKWQGHRVNPRHLATFRSLTGVEADGGLPLLYPQVIGFRLNMAVLTHPRFPLPIWKALQSRNRITQYAPLSPDARYTICTEASAQRILEKGVEIDLLTTVRSEEALVWQATNTFYYRGRFGVALPSPPDAAAPQVDAAVLAQWRTRSDVAWKMARLTGDYNGIHLFDAYARLLGFSRAFHHPQLIVAQSLARFGPAPEWPQELAIWLKGPVPYGADVRLDATARDNEVLFALYVDDMRPAIVGRWCLGRRADTQVEPFEASRSS